MSQVTERKPDFIIIGAAKAGTTSLYKKMSMHPDVFMTTPKEPEFFARDDVYKQGIEWYRELYAKAEKNKICGEASTLYSLITNFPETASRIHKEQPNVKIIFVLRNPVDRAYSYYIQILKNYQSSTKDFSINRTFEECIFPEKNPNRKGRSLFFAPFDSHHKDIPSTFLGGGMYMMIINEYLKYFPRKNILLIKFEDLVINLESVTQDVCDFLEIDGTQMKNTEVARENISKEYFLKLDQNIREQEKINTWKNFLPIRVISTYIPKILRQKIIGFVMKFSGNKQLAERPKKMEVGTRDFLKQVYLPEISALEKFWGKELDAWK